MLYEVITLKKWEKIETRGWHSEKKSSGGGVLIDIGIQLLDLALYIINFPKLKKVKLYRITSYNVCYTKLLRS